MSVFLPPRGTTYRYDFTFNGRRYAGTTHQTTQADAELMEAELRRRLRHDAGGIAQYFPDDTPRFADWAQLFLKRKAQELSRPDHVQVVTGVLLRFFGARPAHDAITGEPYHDLRLGHVVADPSWILKFEAWMAARGIGAQSKNHYRSMLRRMYAMAQLPEYRQVTGVTTNPFEHVRHDPTVERTVALTPDETRRWLAHASYYVRLAMAIAALAPKLRLAKVLGLMWTQFEPDPRATKFNPRIPHFIVLADHKTVRTTKRPQAMPVSAPLLTILRDAWRRQPSAESVVLYQGRRVQSIHGGVKAAAIAAGIPYGRAVEGGATFHTLRHTAATLLSLEGIDPLTLKDAMGHSDLRTTLKYRHLRPEHERPAIEQLAKRLRIATAVMAPGLRPSQPRPKPRSGEMRSTAIASDENGRHSNGRFRSRK
jgi:integrase